MPKSANPSASRRLIGEAWSPSRAGRIDHQDLRRIFGVVPAVARLLIADNVHRLRAGKRQGSFPDMMKARAIAEMLAIESTVLIQPTNPGLVLMPDGELKMMHWGFRRRMRGVVKKTVMRIIVNTREDNLDSHTWRDAIEHRRCIIPMTLAFEWNGPKGNLTTYGMTAADNSYLWVAGIWERGR